MVLAGLLLAGACSDSSSATTSDARDQELPDGPLGGLADAAEDAAASSSCSIFDGDAGTFDGGMPLYASAEAILGDSRVSAAVAAVQALAVGSDFLPNLGSSPPTLAGTWTTAQGAERVIASIDGRDVGLGLAGGVAKVTQYCLGALEVQSVAMVNGMQVTTNTSLAYVRGEGQSYSTFAITHGLCTIQGSAFSYFYVGLSVGKLVSGKITSKSLLITLATEGELTTACANGLVKSLEEPGAWSLLQGSSTVAP